MDIDKQNDMYWTRMRERASKPLEEKMLSLVGGHDILLRASLHDDEYSNYYVYKEDWFFIPGQEWIRYDFMIEYNLRDPNLGIYYGCRCVSDWGSDHEAAIELADRHWAALREEVTAVLNATFPGIDFSRRFRLSDNANDHTYWPFWIRLEEGENIKEVAVRALKLIRTVYARYLGERVRDEDWVMTDGTPTRFTHPALNSLVSRVDDIVERYGGERKGMAFHFIMSACAVGWLEPDPILECGYRFKWFCGMTQSSGCAHMLMSAMKCLSGGTAKAPVPWSAFASVIVNSDGRPWTADALKTKMEKREHTAEMDDMVRRLMNTVGRFDKGLRNPTMSWPEAGE